MDLRDAVLVVAETAFEKPLLQFSGEILVLNDEDGKGRVEGEKLTQLES